MPRQATSHRLPVAAQATSVNSALRVAEDHASHMDPNDTDLQSLAYVVIHCTKALVMALREHE
jgi:hypothetical protein